MSEREIARVEGEVINLTQRQRCPFYGFSAARGNLIDTKGNQCALITNSHSPCRMEMNQEDPDWEACPYNTLEARTSIRKYAENARVFPDELRHETGFQGVPLDQWIARFSS